jgi:coatomer protein complex subunit epsilon
LGLRAQYEMSDANGKGSLLPQLQTMLADSNASVQLTAAHVFLSAGMKKEALQCVHQGVTLEHTSLALQIYLQIDRLDLAKTQLQLLKQADEDSILTQLGSVHIALATGSSMAKDAVHTLSQLSEQYGPSVFLLNLLACAYIQQGQYEQAEGRLLEAQAEGATDADTLVNLIVCSQYQHKPTAGLVQQLKQQYPDHFLAKGLEMVEGAFEREAMKYKVAA